jgi:hypothetical protein
LSILSSNLGRRQAMIARFEAGDQSSADYGIYETERLILDCVAALGMTPFQTRASAESASLAAATAAGTAAGTVQALLKADKLKD